MAGKKGNKTGTKSGNKAQPRATRAAKPLSPPRIKEAADKDGFYVAVIGASAGGLEAFEHFFTSMPEESGMAFILIPHLDPTHKSIMPELLRRYTKMPVFQAVDGMKVKPNYVYMSGLPSGFAGLRGRLYARFT